MKHQSFSGFKQFVTEYELQIKNDRIKYIKCHCQMLEKTFEEHFKDYSEFFRISESIRFGEHSWNLSQFWKIILNLSSDRSLKIEFTKFKLMSFGSILKINISGSIKKSFVIFMTIHNDLPLRNGFLYKLKRNPNNKK